MSTMFLIRFKSWFQRVFYFFPLQLLLIQLKRNITLVGLVVLLLSIVVGGFGRKYGLPNLLLFPEYLNKVGILSHFILGFSVGGFITSFNVISYVENGFRFPFIATLNNPFLKFCINNFIIPLTFVIIYASRLWTYQTDIELLAEQEVIWHLLGFVSGMILFIALSLLYFNRTDNTLFSPQAPAAKRRSKYTPVKGLLQKNEKWYHLFSRNSDWRIETYISGKFRIRLARTSVHYSRATLASVFEKNQMNSSFFQMLVIITLLVLGIFSDHPLFVIPAGASIFLLFTLFLMIYGALFSWFKTWSGLMLVVIFIGVNVLVNNGILRYENRAYGLNYEKRDNYSNAAVRALADDDSAYASSLSHEIEALNAWKKQTGKQKPWMVVLNTSGGGLRSALFTYQTLFKVDSALEGALGRHLRFASGASGGMMGMALFRESMFVKPEARSELISNMGRDLLNPVAFTLAVHDLFLRFGKEEIGGYSYQKDRGLTFEKALNRNLNGIFDKSLGTWKEPVQMGLAPHMVFGPTNINDGRIMMFSSQPIRFLMRPSEKSLDQDAFVELVDGRGVLPSQHVDNLRYSTLIRMNASFPYIMPNVSLPTNPKIELMDAGMRDNLGVKISSRYIRSIRDWAKDNIGGIVILQLNDAPNLIKLKDNPTTTAVNQVFSPLGAVYENLFNTQRYQSETLENFNRSIDLGVPIRYMKLSLRHDEKNYVALSWHLTEKEKNHIAASVKDPSFARIVEELRKTLTQHQH